MRTVHTPPTTARSVARASRTAGLVAAIAALLVAAACASSPPTPEPVPAAPSSAVVPTGSDMCYLTVADAVKNPRLEVERVPAPVKMDPPIFKPPYPRGVFGKGNYMELAWEVLVDTLGKPDMSTFVVLKASHPWFATQAQKAATKWTFTPAEKGGCKVPRFYKFGISSGPKPAKSP